MGSRVVQGYRKPLPRARARGWGGGCSLSQARVREREAEEYDADPRGEPKVVVTPSEHEGPSQVAARLLAEILALDLGNLTPIRALTLLHELQTQRPRGRAVERLDGEHPARVCTYPVRKPPKLTKRRKHDGMTTGIDCW